MSDVKLSILISSLPERTASLGKLLKALEHGLHNYKDEVELLVLMDNRHSPSGVKRNHLIDMAKGEFVVNIDDDDLVSEDFISEIMYRIKVIAPNVDLIAYNAEAKMEGYCAFTVLTGMDFENEQPKHCGVEITNEIILSDIKRKPWHWCTWRRELAQKARFPEFHTGAEDAYFLDRAYPLVRAWTKINKVLYYHFYHPQVSAFDSKPS